jgi:hypothetical protein
MPSGGGLWLGAVTFTAFMSNNTLSIIWLEGLGSLNTNNIITTNAPLWANVLFANAPQLALTFFYLN